MGVLAEVLASEISKREFLPASEIKESSLEEGVIDYWFQYNIGFGASLNNLQLLLLRHDDFYNK